MRDPHQMIAGPDRILMKITHPGFNVLAMNNATGFYRLPEHRGMTSPDARMRSWQLSRKRIGLISGGLQKSTNI